MRDEELAAEELIMLQHLDDDAQRDLGSDDQPMDRADAKEASGDVARMEGETSAALDNVLSRSAIAYFYVSVPASVLSR